MAYKYSHQLQILRSIVNGWRNQTQKPAVQSSQAYKYLLHQFRHYQASQSLICKGPNEMEHLAQTYETYLSSTVQLKALHDQYFTKEQRSIEDTARLVGLTTHARPEKPKNN